jgi:hypothetical protein
MLVSINPDDLDKTENEILDAIRQNPEYGEANFSENLRLLLSKTSVLIQSAKIYILDNYKNVEDYSDLSLKLTAGISGETFYFGKKRKDRKKIEREKSEAVKKLEAIAKPAKPNPRIEKLLRELDEKTTEIKTIDNVWYDWTDGDFSISINGSEYLWIDDRSIITIADYINKKLVTDEEI